MFFKSNGLGWDNTIKWKNGLDFLPFTVLKTGLQIESLSQRDKYGDLDTAKLPMLVMLKHPWTIRYHHQTLGIAGRQNFKTAGSSFFHIPLCNNFLAPGCCLILCALLLFS